MRIDINISIITFWTRNSWSLPRLITYWRILISKVDSKWIFLRTTMNLDLFFVKKKLKQWIYDSKVACSPYIYNIQINFVRVYAQYMGAIHLFASNTSYWKFKQKDYNKNKMQGPDIVFIIIKHGSKVHYMKNICKNDQKKNAAITILGYKKTYLYIIIECVFV